MPRIALTFTIDTDQPPEQLRDQTAKQLGAFGTVIHSGCANALPRFRVLAVNVDKRMKAPQPVEQVVEAESADAAAAEVASGTMVVAHVEPVT